MRFRVLATAATTAVLALTLTACGGGSPEPPPIDASAEPSSSPSPTAASSPTPDAEPSPSPSSTSGTVITEGGGSVDAATKAAATAFTRQVLQALDKGANTGDFADALRLFDTSCDTCKQGIAYAQGIYAKNQKIVGGQYEDPKFSVSKSPVADVVVRVDSTVAGYKVVDASGKTVGQADAEPDISNYHLKKSGDTWHVVRWSYT